MALGWSFHLGVEVSSCFSRLALPSGGGGRLSSPEVAVRCRTVGTCVPQEVVENRVGRLTAFNKPDGVRGIVVADTVPRFVARTVAQQLATAVEDATAPFQYALSTREGCECIAYALQGLTELNPEATVTSIDGIGAFDLISRESMMTGLRDVAGGGEVLPFVRMFHGAPSEYLWEGDAGDVYKIPQGEGGEQGDKMMPLLYSLGQHRALEAIHREMGGPINTSWHSWTTSFR